MLMCRNTLRSLNIKKNTKGIIGVAETALSVKSLLHDLGI